MFLDVVHRGAVEAGCGPLVMEGLMGVQQRFFAAAYNTLDRLDQSYGNQWRRQR